MNELAAMRVGSLFTGIGGFDLGFEQCGMEISWQVENNRFCLELLGQKWPDIERRHDVRYDMEGLERTEIICGGDPCPCRSLAKGSRATSQPDLSGWFLAVVGRLRPEWVVRENVFAPDVVEFTLGLESLGYGMVVVGFDSRDFTGQSRRRQFVLGCSPGKTTRLRGSISNAADDFGFDSSRPEETTPIAACLTAHPSRMAAEDSYCFEPEKGGLRFLAPEECEALQGFPRGWTAGFSKSRRRIMLGNAVTVPIVRWIGSRIIEVNGSENG